MRVFLKRSGLFVLGVSLVLPLAGATFDEQRKAISASVETQPEKVIVDLLKAGIEEGKPTQAIAEARKWLRQNIAADINLLYLAGRAAELSGDASGSAALYQQFLKKADPKSEVVGPVVIAVDSQLRIELNDIAAAYSFNRSLGDRLAVNPISRQFDQWFLAEARKRQDVLAVANRLHANIKAGVSVDLLQTHYWDHFRWLLAEVDGYLEQGRKVKVTDKVLTAYRQLAKVISFDEEMALRLNWAVAVRAYNLGKVADQDAEPPLAEAKALLAKFPEYAKWVQDGWAGGGNGQYYRSETSKFWPHETEAKLAPVVAAASKLSPMKLAELVSTWSNGYYGRKEIIPLQVKVIQDYLMANPKLTNSRTGPMLLDKSWNQYTPEEAQTLAPKLAANAHPEASFIRAIAAGSADKNFDKMIAAILGPEVWRLGRSELEGRYADQLWHYAGRPGGNGVRDQKIKESKDFWNQAKQTALDKKAPADQRLARFRQLWSDYKSNSPKIPGVVSQLKATLKITPEAIPELLRDQSPDAQVLARNAIAEGFEGAEPIWNELEATNRVNVTSYAPGILYLAQRHGGGDLAVLKQRMPQKAVAHPLEPALRESVANGLKQQKLEPWTVMAWVNMQYPEGNAQQVKLAQELVKSSLWKSLPSEIHYALREWFKKDVMTPGQIAMLDASDVKLISAELFALIDEESESDEVPENGKKKKKRRKPKPDATSDPEQFAEDLPAAISALEAAIKGLREAPVRLTLPEAAFEELAALDPAVIPDPKVQELLLELVDSLKITPVPNNFGHKFVQSILKNLEPLKIHQTAPYIWQFLNRSHHSFAQVRDFTQSLVNTHPSAASAMASSALNAFARHRGHSYFNRETDPQLFKSIRGNAAMKMGLADIPVPKGSPSYPIYQSQADWLTGNEESAWEFLEESWDELLPIHRELSLGYLRWVLQRVIYSRDETRQEELIKALMAWALEDGSPLTPEEKIGIEMAYGDIAMQRGQLRQAHEIFSRTAANEKYIDYDLRHQATLRRAKVERLAKNFDGALQTLNQLELERVPGIATDLKYSRALVFFDMEEFDDAADEVDDILTRDPSHADAKILLGKVQLKRQKLMEATEVELGSASQQRSLFPGEKLKVTLSDPTLAVSGAGTEIEVVVWATSGDRETFFLRQFGDQKTKFRGELATSLGKPNPGDRNLQVIGDDEIFYAYSERFRTRMNNLPEKRGGPIIVASDAVIMASARKLLTADEQRLVDMEALMKELERRGVKNAEKAAKTRLAEQAKDLEARTEGTSEYDQARIARIIKPGNPINVRVIDPDRSRTDGIDELTVSVSSSSGDSIARYVLKETDTHTGHFEGRIPTTGAQAMVFAPSSQPGSNPNMLISPKDDYPAWRPLQQKDKVPELTIDLNDNYAVENMTIRAAEEGAKLQKFVLQAGMNASSMTTIASFPKQLTAIKKPWHPSVLVMNDTDHHHARDERSVYDLNELRAHVEGGWMNQRHQGGVADNVVGPSEALTPEIPGRVKWLRQDRHHNAHVVYRFRGYFYEPRNVTRRFKLNLGNYTPPKKLHSSVAHPPQFLLAVDGRPITDMEKPNQLEGQLNLRSGVHSFEIWATGWDCTMGFGRSIKLLANLEEQEGLVDCPDSFFDPESFPPGVLDHRNAPAGITASEDGSSFAVKFGEGSRARLLKLVILGHEGSIPAVNRIALSGENGKKILPVAEDFASLRKNETLEILTGDRVSVRYVDDRFVTKSKEKLERSLEVSFTDAKVEFADMEPRFDSRKGEVAPFYEKLLRFSYDEPLSVAVHDADMDVSVEPDTVKVRISSGSGGEKELVATETGASTGVFKATIVPVKQGGSGENQIVVSEGGTLVGSYLDTENNRPGVVTTREGRVLHAGFQKPVLSIAHATAEMKQPSAEEEEKRRRWTVTRVLTPSNQAPEGGINLFHGHMAYFELEAPQLALRPSSTVSLYAQTESGRKAAEATNGEDFDISVPGTVELSGQLSEFQLDNRWQLIRDGMSKNYWGGGFKWGIPNHEADDRFRFSVPLVADVLPLRGVLGEEERDQLRRQLETSRSAARILEQAGGGLVVRPGETIHLGVRYKERDGKEKWLTASAKVGTRPIFEIVDDDNQELVTSAYAGETLNLRVSDHGADLTDAIDEVSVLIQAKSGAKGRLVLRETDPHSGVFTAGALLSYAKKEGALPEGYDLSREGLPVIYGDTVAARYTDANGIKTPISMVTISKGADGTIQPFSKQYEDLEVAMQTQFSLAEAYLEIAKRHRKLGETELAAREYRQAKLLLANAMEDFKEPETRAHAEYLLGNLTLEEADTTPEGELKEDRYRVALSRFMTVTGTYPGTIHASRAQFRIATIYEKLKEPEIAAQEYVKLAYKYPDSEFLAISMVRLGSHFLKKAAKYESESKPLLAQEDDKDAMFKGEALSRLATKEYIKTAQIFSRMQERFPNHEMAGAAGLRAGQAYMRSGELNEAIAAFGRVIVEKSYDGKKIRSQAMYWTGKCYQDRRELMSAYSIYKRLTYDFPESEWAAYARGQLSQESLLNLEYKLELERLEEAE
ncbi:MAG: tetratricopeptide repeat protein [Akkermansiaceae bacterium]